MASTYAHFLPVFEFSCPNELFHVIFFFLSTSFTWIHSHSSAAPGRQPFNMASALISLSNGTGTAKARAAKSLYSSRKMNVALY